MALEFKLVCRCFKDGKFTTRPPHEEFLKTNEEGEFFFDYPEEIYEYTDDEEYSKIFQENESWKRNICTHNNSLESGSLYSFSRQMGINFVLSTMLEGDWEKYPTVRKYYPANNSGILPLQHAPAFVEELKTIAYNLNIPTIDLFYFQGEEKDMIRVIRKDDWMHFGLMSDNSFGLLDKDGFNILKLADSEAFEAIRRCKYGNSSAEILKHADVSLLFRSKHFTLDKNESKYVYTDIESKTVFESDFNHITQAFSGNTYHDCAYRVGEDEYDFEEYRSQFERVLDAVRRAIENNCDIRWT